MAITRTPGTGGVIDLWKNSDGTPSKLARGPWAEGRGKPQGVGKRWRGWYVGDDGKQHTKRFRIEAEAEAWSNTERGKVVTNVWISPDVGTDTFRTAAELWLKTKEGAQRKAKTLAGYRSILDTVVLPRWGETPLKKMSYPELSAWFAGLSVDGSQAGTALSASRIRQTHQLMGSVFKYALKAGMASKNVIAEIERSELPSEQAREMQFLTHQQLLDLAQCAGKYQTLTLVLGYCGIRFSEAAALRRSSVKNGKMTIRESATSVAGKGMVTSGTKTGKIREVAVPPPVWVRLVAELPPEPEALVFPGRNGNNMTLGQYRWVFDRAVRELRTLAEAQRQADIEAGDLDEHGQPQTPEFPTISPHALRHTAASLLISTGANIKVVQRQLGHATASMTLDRYGHLYSDDLTAAATALGEAMQAVQRTA
ncbi:tyrosine-type recombinase/integrase [Mycolicibacterium smegmatis]|uniref:tyrosine-type recombinase/integrase n=1 Tax=Mycolicibacterium smegmatis TaxID=1772 RepID=UPI001E5766DA|nr:site-specific integrase [Mycolicibacterium smegmatis]